jgi:PQQ-dependent catabolism-associated CXXCW motif protein
MKFATAACLALIFAGSAHASPPSTRDEIRDWGVPPITSAKREDLHSPTPTTIPGGKTILASELYDAIRRDKPPVVIDVLGGELGTRSGLPGAIYMGDEVGKGRIGTEMRDRFRDALKKVTGGDKEKPLVFYCLSAQCWLSYNAALRAIAAGYTNVYWFRGGIEAWNELRYPSERAKPFDW